MIDGPFHAQTYWEKATVDMLETQNILRFTLIHGKDDETPWLQFLIHYQYATTAKLRLQEALRD